MFLSEPKPITPILKRRRNSNSESDALPPKRGFMDDASIQCAIVLERLHMRGMAPSYETELIALKESTVLTQISWLTQLTASGHMLSSKAAGLGQEDPVTKFVCDILKLPWKLNDGRNGQAIRKAFQEFVISLSTSHIEYLNTIISVLFRQLFRADLADEDGQLRTNPHFINPLNMAAYMCVINTIVALNTKIPLSASYILQQAADQRPYFKRHPHLQVIYIKSLLVLTQRIPVLKSDLLYTVIRTIVNIDVNCKRENLLDDSDAADDDQEVFQMEVDSDAPALRQHEAHLKFIFLHPEAHSLDCVMECVMLWLHCQLHNVPYSLDRDADHLHLARIGCRPASVKISPNSKDQAEGSDTTGGCECGGQLQVSVVKPLYNTLYKIFADYLLTTHSLEYTQFIMFNFLSIRPGLTRTFLDDSTKEFTDYSGAHDVRRNAMSYIGSLLVRGKFVSFSLAQSCLEVIVNWCQNYVKAQEAQGAVNNYPNLNVHQLFYCACQTVFYVLCFRCREFTRNKRTLDFVSTLNLEHLVFSKLNPLKYCAETIAQNFAAIMRHYQIVPCYGIIKANKANHLPTVSAVVLGMSASGTELDTNFPFDPYMLKVSNAYIAPHYQEFEGLPEEISTEEASDSNSCSPKDTSDTEEDDFLDQSGSYHTHTSFGPLS